MNYTNYFTFLGQIILHFWCILFYKFEIHKRKYIPILYKIQYFKDHFCGEAAIFKLLIIFLLGGGAAGIKTTIYVNFGRQLSSIQRPFFCRLEECEYALATNIRSLFLGGGAAGIKRQLMSILYVNYRQFFSICGLEECACTLAIQK